ncbi:hypothetical protein [Eubacterium ruminantium]|uniref:hypothetical protein n=1 Tax=Eubacterium ruminantium TaxID=42322 RepID=UPI00247AFEB5|nr:hypothetical protein [Eubacterium ruminantium]
MKLKKIITVVLAFSLILTLTACGKDNKIKKYSTYIENLIAVNYLGASDAYIESTGANKEDAEAMYAQNVDRLAIALKNYYGLVLTEDDELFKDLHTLAEMVYGNAKYSVDKTYKSSGHYKVDITIYPIDIITQADQDAKAYVEKFNEKVAAGEFNNYDKETYEHEFAEGLVDILKDAAKNMTYRDPQTITVTIVEDGDTFYISNEDFIKIDDAMVAGSTAVESTESETTESESTSE